MEIPSSGAMHCGYCVRHWSRLTFTFLHLLLNILKNFTAMATTSAPQLNNEWFECSNMDGEWTKPLANVQKMTEDILLWYLVVVERVSYIHRSKNAAKKTKSFKEYTFFWDGHVQKMHVWKSFTNDPIPIVKAQVLASMKKIHYKDKVYVGVQDCCEIAGTYCDCVAW